MVLVILAAALVAGCGASSGKGTVVAAFYPLAYAAERIGGPALPVEDLTPAGAEPHDLELAPKAVARIDTADVVLYLGHGFQPAVSKAVDQARGKRVDVLQGLPLRRAGGGENTLTADPHVWLDPVLFARIAKRIGHVLGRTSTALRRDLGKLDRDYRTGLRSCRRREVVTSHAAFGYLAARTCGRCRSRD